MVKLSLCVIVGKNEAFELERLLKSVQGPLFDEIVVTTTQNDEAVKAVATKYSDKTPHFDWIKDFSAARNYCFDQSTGEYIMWMDSDDILTPENYSKLLEVKTVLQNYAVVFLNYNYGHYGEGSPSLTLPRERIVKRLPELRWHDPIHEYIAVYANLPNLHRHDISVEHMREKEYNASRNLEILEKVYNEGKASPRIKFYYGKDLIDSGNFDKALKVFNEYLSGPTDFDQNKAVACIRLAEAYLAKQDESAAVMYARRGMMFNDSYAELYFILGDYYQRQKDSAEAVKYFKMAVSKSPDGLFAAKPDFYKRLPLDRLMHLYYAVLKDYRAALGVCEEFLKHYPEDKNYQFNRQSCLGALSQSQTGQAGQALPPPSTQETPTPERTVLKPFEGEIKVAWMLSTFNSADPSQRIRRLNMHRALQSKGINSVLFTEFQTPPAEWTLNKLADHNVVVFSSFGDLERTLMVSLKARGAKILLDINEAIFDIQAVRDTLKEADMVVCCSSKLLELAKPFAKKLVVIEDPAEQVETEYNYFQPAEADGRLRALYIGMGGNSFLVSDYLRETIEKAGYKLTICSEWDNADVKWSLDSWEETMNNAHVILCPQRYEVQPAKSNVKVTQAMSMGIPVVASPLQAYKEIVTSGVNGYICDNTLSSWNSALVELKDLKKRIQVGMNGKDTSGRFTLASLSGKWEMAVRTIMGTTEQVRQAPQAPAPQQVNHKKQEEAIKQVVPIIIPVYNGVNYLKACISSIHMNTTYPYHIILSDAGSDQETWEYLNTLRGITVLGAPGVRKNFSEACNAGIGTIGNSRFFVLLNSDVLVSRGWLEALVYQMENVGRLAACGVLSNCDRGWMHGVPGRPTYKMKLDRANLELVPGMKYEQYMPHLDELNEFMAQSNQDQRGKFIAQPWVAAYATIFAKSAIDDVGLLDPVFKNGCEDLDLCQRFTKMGYNIGQALDSFVFHAGGVSRGAYQQEAREQYDAEDRYNHETYAVKWAKKNLVIYTGPAWEPWNRAKVGEGMAGSETWAAELGAEFSRRGFNVTIFNEPVMDGEVDQDGVTYMHHSRLQEYVNYRHIDFCILSRTCEPPKYLRLHSAYTYVMVHDIWLNNDKNYDTRHGMLQKFGVLSDWHRDFFCAHHNIPKEKTFLTMNGVNQELYAGVEAAAKKNKVVYSSSADRGLKHLLGMLPKIREQVPDFEIDVCYGLLNWESAAKQRNNPNELAEIENIKQLMKQPGVNYFGRVSKVELARLQKEAKVWLFPTWFSETFCVSGVENGLAGNALVTTPYAGLLTTLGDAPVYIRGPEGVPVEQACATPEYATQMIAEAVKLLKDEEYRLSIANRAYSKVKGYTWSEAADGWLREFKLL